MLEPKQIKLLADEFDQLKAPDAEASHPFEYLRKLYPNFDSFRAAFNDLAADHIGPVNFQDYLKTIYRDMNLLPEALADMRKGREPFKMNEISRSYQLLIKLLKKKIDHAKAKTLWNEGENVH